MEALTIKEYPQTSLSTKMVLGLSAPKINEQQWKRWTLWTVAVLGG